MPRTDVRGVLLLGFVAMIALIAINWVIFHEQLERSHASSASAKLAAQKMEVIAGLIETARKRTRLATQLTLTEDPFDRDDISIKLDIEAANFAQARLSLLASKLSDEEQRLIAEIGKLTAPTLAKQREASQLSLSDDSAKRFAAQKMVMFDVLPLQGRIIDKFMELFRYQRAIIDASNERADQDYRRMVRLGGLLVAGSAMLALAIATFVIRRTVRIERSLSDQKIRLETTLCGIADAVISVDRDLKVDYMNPAAEQLTGETLATAAGKLLGEVFDARDEYHDRSIETVAAAFIAGNVPLPVSSDIRLRARGGERHWIDLRVSPLENAAGQAHGVVLSFHDDTTAWQHVRQIEQQARTDALTGLANRLLLEARLLQTQQMSQRSKRQYATLLIDLDRFKPVNDRFGHAIGDELLRQVANRLTKLVRAADTVARLGGDEFVIVLSEITSQEHAGLFAKKVINELGRTFRLHGIEVDIGASVGVALGTGSEVSLSEILRRADHAMYAAKESGRGRWSLAAE